MGVSPFGTYLPHLLTKQGWLSQSPCHLSTAIVGGEDLDCHVACWDHTSSPQMIAVDTDPRTNSVGRPMSSKGSGKESKMHQSLSILRKRPRKYSEKAEDKNMHQMHLERVLGQEESLQGQVVTMLEQVEGTSLWNGHENIPVSKHGYYGEMITCKVLSVVPGTRQSLYTHLLISACCQHFCSRHFLLSPPLKKVESSESAPWCSCWKEGTTQLQLTQEDIRDLLWLLLPRISVRIEERLFSALRSSEPSGLSHPSAPLKLSVLACGGSEIPPALIPKSFCFFSLMFLLPEDELLWTQVCWNGTCSVFMFPALSLAVVWLMVPCTNPPGCGSCQVKPKGN